MLFLPQGMTLRNKVMQVFIIFSFFKISACCTDDYLFS